MAAKTIRNLKSGEKVRLRFHGSKQFGNDPYELDMTFVELRDNGERAVFSDDGTEFEAYKYANRWAYGSSAERLTVVAS
jgi:hypothetical protein